MNISFDNKKHSRDLLIAVRKLKGVIPQVVSARTELYHLLNMCNNVSEFSNSIKTAYDKGVVFPENPVALKLQLLRAFNAYAYGSGIDCEGENPKMWKGFNRRFTISKARPCNHCKRYLPIKMFNKDKTKSADGYQSQCVDCKSIRSDHDIPKVVKEKLSRHK